MKTITITIDTDGSTAIDTTGFKGSSCKDATKEIERALGLAGDNKRKAEYYQKENQYVKVIR